MWQPIETAPRSTFNIVKRVILWNEDHKTPCFGEVYDDGEGGIFVSANGYHGKWNITHWMPLPEPPNKAENLT